MLIKNENYPITITDMSHEGLGIGHIDGIAVFVADSAVGDLLEIKIIKLQKTYCYGKIITILTPSLQRIPVDCVVNQRCGGCTFRHISYEAELGYKKQFVLSNVKRIGKIDYPFDNVIASPQVNGYRNKAQYPVKKQNDQTKIGFYAKRTHEVIGCMDCKLQPSFFADILNAIHRYIEEYQIPIYDETTHTGLIRHIYIRHAKATDQVMVCIVINGMTIPYSDQLTLAIKKSSKNVKSILLNLNHQKGNIVLGNKNIPLFGKEYITDILCGLSINISPLSFYQVNHDNAEVLYEIAKEFADLDGTQTVLDLYCGTGTIGLTMANKAKKIIGIEIINSAIKDAKNNAKNNHIENAEFICDDVSHAIEQLIENAIVPDVVVLDPPRKGCEAKLIQQVGRLAPEKVVMISCNSATMARDIALFAKLGYMVVAGKIVDLFPRTGHVETVCLLSKLKSDHHIEVNLNMDELDLTSAESKATYEEIKEYVLENSGFKVSSLYIGQVKEKMGIKERENYNISKKEDARVPKCPTDKEKAIVDALKHFNMID